MPEPTRIDPERLAALIDGRLADADAAALRAQLATADADTLAAYADAVAATGALAGVGDVRPITSARSSRRRLWPAIGVAAAAIALLSVWLARRPSADALQSPAQLVAALEDGAPRGSSELDVAAPAWSGVRGTGDAALARSARAVRIGARLVDLELAVHDRRGAPAAAAAAEIVRLLDGLPAPTAPLAAVYTEVGRRAGAAPDSLERQLSDVWAETARLAGRDDVLLGAWLQAARVAAARRDAAFFAAPASRAAVGRLPSASRSLHLATAAATPEEWAAVARELDALLATLAGAASAPAP